MMAPRPPRLALQLLETFLPEDARDAVIGDLTESWERDLAARRRFVWLRFWRESIHALTTLQTMPADIAAYRPSSHESWAQSFVADVRHATRGLSRTPGFALLSTVTLAVAIAASATLLSVANPLLFQVVPYPSPDRLVMINERAPDGGTSNLGYPTYLDLRAGARSLGRSAAFGTWEPTMFGDGEGERLRGLRVTTDFFRTLGVQPSIGRDFLDEEDMPDRNQVVILSHGLWQRRFASDSAVIGRTIDLGYSKPIIVGVLPASFENVLDPTSQVYRVLGYTANEAGPGCRSCRHLRAIGRLRDGVTREAAQRDLDIVMRRIAGEHPAIYRGNGTVVEAMSERATKGTRAIFLVTIGAVALLLLIAAANVVNLQLARAARRDEEFAVRAALGAGRGRIARQLLAEGLVVAVIGGAAGMVLAGLALPSLAAQLPATLPRLESVQLDWQVLVFIAALVMLLGVAIGLIPAVQAGRRPLMAGIRAGGARGGGTPHHRTRTGIVVAEVAVAMMLVVGAALLGRTLVGLLSVDLGFDADNLVTMSVQEAGPRYDSASAVFAHHDAVREAVARVPGVVGVGLTSQLPLGGNMDQYGIRDRDYATLDPGRGLDAERYAVSADYLRAMQIRLVRGQAFTEDEIRDTASRVVIVSDALAGRMWPGQDPIGRYISIGGAPPGEQPPYFRVIGVAAATRHAGLDRGASPQVYVPERQWRWPETTMTLVARVSGDPERFLDAIFDAARSVDPTQPVLRVATMEQVVTRSIGQRRLGMILFVSFGAMALLLAAAGIYGVLAGSVAERTREFGVRAAFGATPAAITALVLRDGAVLTAAGLAMGGAGALLLSRYLRALLYGVSAWDPTSIILSVAAIALVALAACIVPAHRATRTDPVTALRAD
jgi:putative ABC transport system permease protein